MTVLNIAFQTMNISFLIYSDYSSYILTVYIQSALGSNRRTVSTIKIFAELKAKVDRVLRTSANYLIIYGLRN